MTLSNTGKLEMDNNLVVTGASTHTGTSSLTADVKIGGGFGAPGVTITATGTLSMDGALKVGSTSTLTGKSTHSLGIDVGAGYGANSAGSTFTSAGAVSIKDSLF